MTTNYTGRERRGGNTPIPDNLKEILNEVQWRALSGIKYSGWELRFLRRPLFQEPVLVVHNPNDGRIGVLDSDGSIKIQPDIKVSERGMQTHTPPSNNPLVWTK
jgi:hypothetical protein